LVKYMEDKKITGLLVELLITKRRHHQTDTKKKETKVSMLMFTG